MPGIPEPNGIPGYSSGTEGPAEKNTAGPGAGVRVSSAVFGEAFLLLFPSVGTTERPDTVAAKINEGRIAVLVDGTPFALIVPYLFLENFQSVDDYCQSPVYVSLTRILRFLAFAFTILLPGLYVAVVTFHPELFPPSLLYNIASIGDSTPFPLMVEAIFIHLVYELMMEAGLRLPRPIGHAMSIVGALVIGDAIVRAGLVGSPMVTVVALTAIASFVIPSLYGAITILRFLFILLGGFFGLYGVVAGVFCLAVLLCALDSFAFPTLPPSRLSGGGHAGCAHSGKLA